MNGRLLLHCLAVDKCFISLSKNIRGWIDSPLYCSTHCIKLRFLRASFNYSVSQSEEEPEKPVKLWRGKLYRGFNAAQAAKLSSLCYFHGARTIG